MALDLLHHNKLWNYDESNKHWIVQLKTRTVVDKNPFPLNYRNIVFRWSFTDINEGKWSETHYVTTKRSNDPKSSNNRLLRWLINEIIQLTH